MQVKIEKAFSLAAPAGAAWALLQDIRAVAECMPGTRITEQLDATHYKGQVSVKLGPAAAQFNGELEVQGVDDARREIKLVGKGSDTKGSSAAAMNLSASIRDAASGCELVGVSEVSVSGKLASFGGRMMTQVSDQLLKQFADRFAGRLAAAAAPEPAAAPHAAAAAAPAARQLNALALFWSALLAVLKSLFGRKAKT
jgi:carbon monoxide dehydrogenase subunit G